MREKSRKASSPSERLVKSIRRATRKQYSAEEKIRIVAALVIAPPSVDRKDLVETFVRGLGDRLGVDDTGAGVMAASSMTNESRRCTTSDNGGEFAWLRGFTCALRRGGPKLNSIIARARLAPAKPPPIVSKPLQLYDRVRTGRRGLYMIGPPGSGSV
jgi:hypothetical protein